MNITIKDIAKDTGLSSATISKYMNNKKILPENKIIIQESIKRLGFVPNKSAQSLRSKKSNTIAVLLPLLGDYFWGSITSYIEEEFRSLGYSTIICARQKNLEEDLRVTQTLLKRCIDGLIIVSWSIDDNKILEYINGRIPFVMLDQVVKNSDCDMIISTNRSGSYEATEYLLSKGHIRIGVIAGTPDSYTMSKRILGIQDAYIAHGLDFDTSLITYGNYTSSNVKKQFQQLMNLPNPPTAIFALGYDLGIGALTEINLESYKIPEELSIVSFDDDLIFTTLNSPLTVVAQNKREIGHQAVNLLYKRLIGDYSDFPQIKSVNTNFIIRKSVKQII